jgi:hypothetical protein
MAARKLLIHDNRNETTAGGGPAVLGGIRLHISRRQADGLLVHKEANP